MCVCVCVCVCLLFFDLVRCGIYHLLGVLCEQFPEHMVSYSQRLVEIYIGTLKSEVQ